MQVVGKQRFDPELKRIIREASQALALLDADRLEELALSCQALNQDFKRVSAGDRVVLAKQAQDSAREMAVFARVLEATRANLNVMRRLRELREGRLEYRETGSRTRHWALTGESHGDN